MAGKYELWLTTDTGLPFADTSGKTILTTFTHLEASRVANDIGRMFVSLPPSFDTRLIVKDRMIQVWRKPPNGTRSLFNVYFINKWRFLTRRDGTQAIWIWGDDPNTLLKRRIIAFRSGTTEADKTGYADDVMKEIVDENLVSAAAARVMPNVTVAADTSSGPSLSKAFSFDNVLRTLQSLNEASRDLGTEVFFDLSVSNVTNTSIAFQFRTYTGQPGQDISDRISFDQDLGNLEEPELEHDYTEEATHIYAGGQGDGITREIQEAEAAERSALSQYGRTEIFVDARRAKTLTAVLEEARGALEEWKPKLRFEGSALDTGAIQFGRDWRWGDKITERYRGQEREAIVYAVNLTVHDNGREVIGVRLNIEGSI